MVAIKTLIPPYDQLGSIPVLEDDDSLRVSLEVLVIKDWNESSLIVKIFSCTSLVKEERYGNGWSRRVLGQRF